MTALADRVEPRLDDSSWPQLGTRLRAAEHAGVDLVPLVMTAARVGPGALRTWLRTAFALRSQPVSLGSS